MTRIAHILTLSCADQPGLVAGIASQLFEGGANILEAQQFDDIETGRFFMRILFDAVPEAGEAIRERMRQVHGFALVTAPDARPYVRMIIERIFPTLPVLSHLEIARGVELKSLGTIS